MSLTSEVAPALQKNRVVLALDLLIEAVLVALLAFCPLALGAVEAWSEGIAFALGAALAVLVAIRKALSDEREQRGWVYLPVVAYLALAAMQLVALPAGFLGAISPKTVALRRELLGDLPSATDVLSRMTASLYPLGTKHDLRLVLLASSVFFAVVTVFRTPSRIRRLMVWVALIGGAIGALALAQDLTHAKGIYGRISITLPPSSGTFVNHNHFAQFLNLCMGAALGLLLSSLHKTETGSRRVAWWTIPILILGGVTIPFSLSRGGLLSMVAAGLVLLMMLARRGRFWRVGAVVLIVAIVAFAGVLTMGIDRIYEALRLATKPQGYETRLRMDKDAVRVWKDFPAIGVGLGAHEWVFPAYERQMVGNVATHVENEYLQTFEEMGLAGLACVAAFAALVIAAWIRASWNRDPTISGNALGLGYGLVAVMVPSLTDYGQHVPAVACMSAVVCGLLMNLGWPSECIAKGSTLRRVAAWAVACACAWVGVWIVVASWGTYRGEVEWDRAKQLGDRLVANNWKGTDVAYTELLSRSAAAVAWQPENMMYRYWDGAYRWRAVTRHRNADGNVELEGEDLRKARQIITDLNQARRLCPTFGLIYWYVGQKERLFKDPIGDAHILKSPDLAPNDATANFLAGRVYADQGRWNDADMRFRRTLALDQSLLNEVIDEYLAHNQSERLIDLFSDSWSRLLALAERLYGQPDKKDLADHVNARGMAMLKQVADRPDADVSVLIHIANYCLGQSRPADAETYFSRAVQLDYGNPDWHFLHARSLEKLQRITDERNELLTTLRLNPHHEGAKELLKTLEKQQDR